jgi:FtsP/CotA-like multicopper oxidase with cupredoxin domain
MIGDWYHRSASNALTWYMRSGSFGIKPVPDSMLINGISAFNYSNTVPARPLDCIITTGNQVPSIEFSGTKTYRLRIINTRMLTGISLLMSGASLTVIEVDGGYRIAGQEGSSVEILFPG